MGYRECDYCGETLEGYRSDAEVCSRKCYEARRSSRRVEAKKMMRSPYCQACGGKIPDTRRSDATTCSIACNEERKAIARREMRRVAKGISCRECGDPIPLHTNANVVYCSDDCRAAVKLRYDEQWRQANPERVRDYVRKWAKANPDVMSNHRHKRRALFKEAYVENVVASQVFDRDGWLCGICGEPIDSDLQWPDPSSVTLDHIIPFAKGGTHEYANCQAAHFGCNSRKGARLVEELE